MASFIMGFMNRGVVSSMADDQFYHIHVDGCEVWWLHPVVNWQVAGVNVRLATSE